MTRPLALLAALIAALSLAACGEREEPVAAPQQTERMTLLLDWLPNADHAGIYAADFPAAGLDVAIETPTDATSSLKLLSTGRADVAITYQPELLLARAKGEDLVAIGALVQKPLNSVISLGDVRRPQDLEGKRIGITGVPADEAMLRAITDEAGIPYDSVEQVRVGYNLVPALLSGKVDAILGAYWNIEGVELERRGKDPTILRLEDIGVPEYDELVLVTTRETARERGPMLRRFLQALAEGHRELRADPSAGIQPLLEANPDLREPVVRASVDATIPTFFPEDRERPWGYLDEPQWEAYAAWMARNELLPRLVTPAEALTNEFLPGEGARPAEATPSA